jgi:hypothetical protein
MIHQKLILFIERGEIDGIRLEIFFSCCAKERKMPQFLKHFTSLQSIAIFSSFSKARVRKYGKFRCPFKAMLSDNFMKIAGYL